MSWSEEQKATGIAVSQDGSTATGASSWGTILGDKGRSSGFFYFEVVVTDTADALPGLSEDSVFDAAYPGFSQAGDNFGYFIAGGKVYRHYDMGGANTYNVPSNTAGTYGFAIDLDHKVALIFFNGALVFVEDMPIKDGSIMRPAVGLRNGADAVLITSEPFNATAKGNCLPWDFVAPVSTSFSSISGTLKVDGAPAARVVRAFAYDSLSFDIDGEIFDGAKPLGHSVSDGNTGEYEIILRDSFPFDVFVVAFDDYGAPFVGGSSVTVGDRIHPTEPNGYVYVCTGSGSLASTEPTWSTGTGSDQLVGSASFAPTPFYRPSVQGPIKPVILAWSPSALFSSGSDGFWYDPSDLSTMFQDASGTVPVQQDGDPIARMLDKSGNNRDLIEVGLGASVLYRTDGIAHWMEVQDGGRMLGHSSPSAMTYPISVAVSEYVDSNVRGYISISEPNDQQTNAIFMIGENSYPGQPQIAVYQEPDGFQYANMSIPMPFTEPLVFKFWSSGQLVAARGASASMNFAEPVGMTRITVGGLRRQGSIGAGVSSRIYGLIGVFEEITAAEETYMTDWLIEKQP